MRILTSTFKQKSLIALSCLITLSTASFAQTSVQSKIDNYYETTKKLQPAFVGLSVVDLKNDSVIVDLNAQKNMIPASIAKLYTTSAALYYLGGDFRFKTYITYRGNVNDKGVLDGDIIIHGSGDPTTGSKYFPETKGFLDTIVSNIKAAGINKVTGTLIIDCSIFDSQAIPTSWVWEDLGKSYAAGVYPVAINDNTFSISFSSPNQDTQFQKVGSKTPPAISVSPYEQSSEEDTVQLDSKKGNFIVKGAIPSPQEIVGIELFQRFVDEGLFTYKQDYLPMVIPIRGKLDTINCLTSPSLEEIVTMVNHKSLNNYAEHLCKYLGYKVYNDGSYSVGTKVITNYFDTLGVGKKGVQLYDGSGLSRFNSTSALHMSTFLEKNYENGGKESIFFKSLPESGTSGTLRLYGFPKEMTGKIHAKTGSMTRVRNMAGYMTTKSGNEVSFCVMLNGYDCSGRDSRLLVVDMLELIYNNY